MEKMIRMLFEVSLTMTVIILIMLILKPLFKRKYGVTMRYFIWMFIMIRLLLPINISFPKAIQVEVLTNQQAFILPMQSMQQEKLPNESFLQEKPSTNLVGDDASLTMNNQVTAPTQSLSSLICLGIFWFFGCITTFVYHVSKYLYYAKKVKQTNIECTKDIQDIMKNISAKYHRKAVLKIYENHYISSPMLMGLCKPHILITDSLLPKQQQEIILEHEFIHYRRHDLYFKLGLFLVKCIHWFNPLVYIMIQEADKDIEFSCDELILKDASIAYRKEYGRTILAILRSNIMKQSTIFTTSFNGNKKTVEERFTMLTDTSKKSKGLKIILISFISIVLVTSLISCVKLVKINDVVSMSEKNNETIYTFFGDIQFVFDKKSGLTLDNVEVDETVKEENITFTLSYLNEYQEPIDIEMIIVRGSEENFQHELYDGIYFTNSNYKIYYKDVQKVSVYGFKGKFKFFYKGTEFNDETINEGIDTCLIATVNGEHDVDISYLVEYSEMVDNMGLGIEILVDGIANTILPYGYKVNDEILKACNISENKYGYIGAYKLNERLVDGMEERLNDVKFSMYGQPKSVIVSVDKVIYNNHNEYGLERIMEVCTEEFAQELEEYKLDYIHMDRYRGYILEDSNDTILKVKDILDETIQLSYNPTTKKLWFYQTINKNTRKIPLLCMQFEFREDGGGGIRSVGTLPLSENSEYMFEETDILVKVELKLSEEEKKIYAESFSLLNTKRDTITVDWQRSSRDE